ncbi:hypothetical protein GMJLKIPL_5715 [Methylobacterium isbiliense]|uniref:Uncharacterized protein n=1 Tax=Methylobacterium isbiliense TaxID=315478 RepID=A0ABQ4SPF3_9HYPH|nr:hypothetical protein GMJLKIPL_5715 [Methylobacterium isbiliense]
MRNRRQNAGLGGERTVGLGQEFLDRTKHQRQRGAELMADVGEKCRLGPIQFRQRRGPLAFILKDACVRNGRRNVPGHQVEKAPVVGVQNSPWTDSDDEETCRSLGIGALERQDDRRFHGVRPEGHRELAAPAWKIRHVRSLSSLGNPAERPGTVPRHGSADRVNRRKCGPIPGQSCAGDPLRCHTLVVQQIERSERDIQRIAVQNLSRIAASGLGGPAIGTSRSKMAQG